MRHSCETEGRGHVSHQNKSLLRRSWTLLITIAVSVATAQAVVADQSPQWVTRNDIVAAVLQLDRNAYRVGDPIRLHVELKNTSGSPIEVFNSSPWVGVAIVVTDSSWNVVSPTGAPDRRDYHSMGLAARPIQPGQTITLANPYDAPSEGPFASDSLEWVNIGHWGYKLDKPGKYSISGIPAVNGYIMAGSAIQSRFYSDRKTPNSNRVEFSVSR